MIKGAGHVEGGHLGEFELIARYFAPLADDAAALALRDDAAVLRPPESREIVISCDTIVAGVHFLPGDPPETIAHKALAVNLSDLAAKGAKPYVYLLALALPGEPAPAWLEAFASGLRRLQEQAGICLVGGDTTRTPGPLTITITALGLVPQGHAVLRLGAKPGDRLYVSGSIGDACLGLRLLQDPALAAAWDLAEAGHDLSHRPLPPPRAAQHSRSPRAQLRARRDRCVGRACRRCAETRAGFACRRIDRNRARAVLLRGAKGAEA